MKKASQLLFLLGTLASTSCTQEMASDTGRSEAPLNERLSRIHVDLHEGAEGDEVEAIQQYLLGVGYFPNATLAAGHPEWRPAVAEMPQFGVFDKATKAALLEFQGQHHLEKTGFVDAATRAEMGGDQCGEPDNVVPSDPRDKWALPIPMRAFPNFLLGNKVKWRLSNTDDGIAIATARTVVRNALADWSMAANVDFEEVTSGENILLSFADLGVNGNVGQGGPDDGKTSGTITHSAVRFNTQRTWSTAFPAPAGQVSLPAFARHELGHAIGIHHSSTAGVLMHHIVTTNNFAEEDRVPAQVLYDEWQQDSGTLFTEIAASHSDAGGVSHVWGLTRTTTPGGFTIAKRISNTSWTTVPGGATQIAVGGDGIPWLTNSVNTIFRRTSSSPTSGSWTVMPGSAVDIAVGKDNSVWVIGTNAGPAGFGIYKWNGTGWDTAPGSAIEITVGPTGIPWVLNNGGNVYRLSNNQATTGSWILVSGPTVDGINARDISVDGYGNAWMLGTPNLGAEGRLYVRDEQVADVANDAPARNQWIEVQHALGADKVSGGSRSSSGVWLLRTTGLPYRQIIRTL